jgi:hypothetical protein
MSSPDPHQPQPSCEMQSSQLRIAEQFTTAADRPRLFAMAAAMAAAAFIWHCTTE